MLDVNRISALLKSLPSQTVMDNAFVHDLRENIEYGRMGLFNFIKQQYGARLLTDLVHQQAAFLISYVTWRRAIQQRGGMFFSLNSLISNRIIAFSSLNKNSAIDLASSVAGAGRPQ